MSQVSSIRPEDSASNVGALKRRAVSAPASTVAYADDGDVANRDSLRVFLGREVASSKDAPPFGSLLDAVTPALTLLNLRGVLPGHYLHTTISYYVTTTASEIVDGDTLGSDLNLATTGNITTQLARVRKLDLLAPLAGICRVAAGGTFATRMVRHVDSIGDPIEVTDVELVRMKYCYTKHGQVYTYWSFVTNLKAELHEKQVHDSFYPALLLIAQVLKPTWWSILKEAFGTGGNWSVKRGQFGSFTKVRTTILAELVLGILTHQCAPTDVVIDKSVSTQWKNARAVDYLALLGETTRTQTPAGDRPTTSGARVSLNLEGQPIAFEREKVPAIEVITESSGTASSAGEGTSETTAPGTSAETAPSTSASATALPPAPTEEPDSDSEDEAPGNKR